MALEQMKNEFRREVEDALEISSVFYTDIQLNEIMETVYDHPADYIEAYDTYLRRILNSAPYTIRSARLRCMWTIRPCCIPAALIISATR